MMANSHLTNLRTAIEWLKKLDEILITDTEVDPHLEYAGIQKRLDGGPALLFEKVKGYPNGRLANNFYSTMERVARFFEVEDPRKFKFKAQQAILHPIPPREVKEAPSQEVVVAKDLDVWQVVPMISHARTDPGRTLGGGNTLVTGQYFWGGTHIGYNRMNFRGKDFSSFQISPGSHMDQIATAWYRKGPIPMTINIGVPPACTMLAGAGFMYMVLPRGSDELGVAGALQGFPVDIVKARTVDAYAIAEAEYVVEGYLDMTQKVWESPIAEAENKQGVHPFHPEWAGYMGKAYRTYKFQATAITHRKDRPIYYGLIVHGMDDHFIDVSMREAAFLEMAERISPGFVVDVHIPMGMTDWGGALFQVRKRRARDEGIQMNILTAALASSLGMRLAIAVDEDIDVYNMEDVMWALTTRVNPRLDIQVVCEGGFGQTFQPAERSSAGERDWTQSNIRFSGGMAIDATVPFRYRDAFGRARYEVEMVDLRKFFTEDQIAKGKSFQYGYAKWMAERGI
ncbi:MAG: UbiD family decarboxylase [Deltaproteobacteria bacterium]|nr:UbiD family decarboxylase [Deltaproteobacteria bacterium]